MNTQDWKNLVGSVAPVLGTALGGPFGGVAGTFLAEALGCDPADLPAKIGAASPETLAQIKNLEHEFKVKMRELGISEEAMHAQDRDSARNLAINTSLKPQAIIAAIFIMGFVVVLYSVFAGKVQLDAPQAQMANILIGILSAGIMQIMNFFFGSSSGSKQKTAQLTRTVID